MNDAAGDHHFTLPDARGARKVLFVCLGNICRSPLAQGMLERLTSERGVRGQFTIESCGIGDWHVGNEPDPRTIAVAMRNGLTLRSRARQLDAASDSARFDLILGMDKRNLAALMRSGCPESKVGLFLGYAAARDGALPLEVPDPYYGGEDGFEDMYRLIHNGAEALLDEMLHTR